MTPTFWGRLDVLVEFAPIMIDRPRFSVHPRYPEVVYPVDYGCFVGTDGGDGAGIDLFRGSAVGAGVVGVFLTADPDKQDVEVKIVLDCSPDEVDRIEHLLREDLGIGGLFVPR